MKIKRKFNKNLLFHIILSQIIFFSFLSGVMYYPSLNTPLSIVMPFSTIDDEYFDLKTSTSIWSNATVVSDSIDIIAGWNRDHSYSPSIAIDNESTLHVVWMDDTNGEWGTDAEIMYANHTITAGWSNATVISDDYTGWNNGYCEDPSIAIDKNGVVHVVWEDHTDGEWGTDSEIMYVNYSSISGWTNVTVISDLYGWNDLDSNLPQIATDNNGNLHVVWEDFTDGEWGVDTEIMYVNYTATGWSNATVISDVYGWNDGGSYEPDIAIDKNDNIHVVWEDITDGEWGTDKEIMYANYTTAMGWSNATVISDDSFKWNDFQSADPSICIDNNSNIHVVWWDETNGEWGNDIEILYVNYTVSGWSNATLVSDDITGWNDGWSLNPDIITDENGVLHVVWFDGTIGEWGSDEEIMYANYTSGWSNATVISAGSNGWNNGISCYPVTVIDNNSVIHVVWQDYTITEWGTDIEIMYTNNSVASWTNATVISDKIGIIPWENDDESRYPSITTDSNGNLHVVWEDDTNGAWNQWGNDIEIMYANFTVSSGWSNAIVISDDSTQWNDGNSTRPKIVIDNNDNIHVVWQDETDSFAEWGTDTEIMYVNYTIGKGWTNATVISDNTNNWNDGESINPSIAVDNNENVHVVWEDSTDSILEWGTDDEIMYTNYTTTSGWSNATVISDDNNRWNTGWSENPSIVVDKNDNIHVVWKDDTSSPDEWGTDSEIMYVNRTGSVWSNATAISGIDINSWNTGSSSAPKIVSDDNTNLHVVWYDYTDGQWGTDAEIMYINCTITGWSNATVISDDNLGWNDDSSLFPSLTVDNESKVHVVWYDYTDGEWGTDVEIMYSTNSYSSWTNATVISDDNTLWNIDDSWYPDITIDNNANLHVVWFDFTDGQWGTDTEIMYVNMTYDFKKPNITSVLKYPTNPGNLDEVNITAHITDNLEVDIALINSNHTGTPLYYPMDLLSGDEQDGYWNYTIPKYPAGTTITYLIWANDTSNNSVIDGPYQYIVRDNENPNITSVSRDPTFPNQFDTVNITVHVTENVGVDIILINSNHTGVTINYTMDPLSGGNQDGYWNYTIPVSPFETTIIYSILVNDSSNNIASDGPYQYTVGDGEAPNITSVSRYPINPTNIDIVNITAHITDNYVIFDVFLISNYSGVVDIYPMDFLSGTVQDGYFNYTIPANTTGTTIVYQIYATDLYFNTDSDGPYQYVIRDGESPNINSTSISPFYYTPKDNVTITVHITENVGVDKVLIFSNHTGTMTEYSMNFVSGTIQDGYWNFTFPKLPAWTVINYSIWVNDTSGNNESINYDQIMIPAEIVRIGFPLWLLALMAQGRNEMLSSLLSPLMLSIIGAIAGAIIIGIVVFKRRSKSRDGAVESRPSNQLPWVDNS